MDLRKELDLDDKYSATRKKIKNMKNELGKKNWSIVAKIAVIVIPIVIFYILNASLAGVFEVQKAIDKTVVLPEASIIDLKIDESLDPDTDGLTNKEEVEKGTNPFNRDTDGDGVTDDGEISLGLNPQEADKDILIDAYKGLNGAKYDIPVNFNGFVIRANNLKSRAYLTAIADGLPNDMPINTINVSGKIEGEGYYERKDGLFEKSNSGESNGQIRIISDNRPDNIKKTTSIDTVTLKAFGSNVSIDNPLLGGLLKLLLPKHGVIAAFDSLNYLPNALAINNLFNASNLDFANETIENLQDNRINLLHVDTSYRDRLMQRLRAGEIVPVSIISQNNEYLLFITGCFNNGNFMAVDAKTRKEVGEMVIKKTAKPMTDGKSLVQMETLTFEIGELGSEKGDRLIFL